MKHKKRKLILRAILLAVAGGIAGSCALMLNRPLHVEKPTYLYIRPDDSAEAVYTQLHTRLQASSLTGLKVLCHVSGLQEHFPPGAYRFDASTRTIDIFRRLKSGRQTPVQLTVPSVRTIGQLLKTVSRQLMADSASLASLLSDSVYTDSLGYTAYTLPALFIPNTYEVYWTVTPRNLIGRMKTEHDAFWNKERRALADSIGFSPVQVATIASIVEEETANSAEKPMVAGLYINRLHEGIKLQADPTVKFGLQQFGLHRILHKHLKQDTPYNTYLHDGLPPGPIRIPSIEGIESVLHYVHHSYLYMCAKEDFSGTHNFARNWNEHIANARRYQQALNQRNIK